MVKKIAIAVVALLVVFGFLLAKDWDSPELGRTRLGKVTEATGVEIDAEGFRLNLLRGLILEFHKHRREFPTGLEGVKGLAELFQTSLTATGIRYATLSTEPGAVVVSEGDRISYRFFRSPSRPDLVRVRRERAVLSVC